MLNQKIIFIFGLVIMLIRITSALSFNPFDENISVIGLYQECEIQNTQDLYCNVLIPFGIINETSQIKFDMWESPGSLKFNNNSILLCSGFNLDEGVVNPYLDFNLENCSKSNVLGESYGNGTFSITINSKELTGDSSPSLFFNYTVKNFVQKDPVYDTLFFNLYINNLSNETFIRRNIILPKDSILNLNSLLNLQEIAIYNDGRRILQTTTPGQSTAVYEEGAKEKSDQNLRDISIILVSIGVSAIFWDSPKKRYLTLISGFLIFLGGISFIVWGIFWLMLILCIPSIILLVIVLYNSFNTKEKRKITFNNN
jgi:hypothetical protein